MKTLTTTYLFHYVTSSQSPFLLILHETFELLYGSLEQSILSNQADTRGNKTHGLSCSPHRAARRNVFLNVTPDGIDQLN
ncbi:hypothetical protein J6590_051580 [Homalodisca vitripennis]|nr:hypothetical protein J6590_051580 [Homalodisca vitripennis]